MKDLLQLFSPDLTAHLSNVKINDTDISFKGLNDATSLWVFCISSESSQEDTVFANKDMPDLYDGKYFYSFDILSSLRFYLS